LKLQDPDHVEAAARDVVRVLELEHLLDRQRERRREADQTEDQQHPAVAAVAEGPAPGLREGHLGGEELVVGEVGVGVDDVGVRAGRASSSAGPSGRAGSGVLVPGSHTVS
jgi:hypothetical protein